MQKLSHSRDCQVIVADTVWFNRRGSSRMMGKNSSFFILLKRLSAQAARSFVCIILKAAIRNLPTWKNAFFSMKMNSWLFLKSLMCSAWKYMHVLQETETVYSAKNYTGDIEQSMAPKRTTQWNMKAVFGLVEMASRYRWKTSLLFEGLL